MKNNEKPFDIPTFEESLRRDVKKGIITLRQAAIELYKGGHCNWVPDEEETRRLLGLN